MKTLQTLLLSRRGKLLLVVSGALTAVICLVMNLVLLPAIERTTQGARCFDMLFAYSYETALRFLSLLSAEGRQIYLTRQLPLDFFYPVCYLCFFSCAVTRLRGKTDAFLLPPLLLAILDCAENVCTVFMLHTQTVSRSLAVIGSVLTSTKTVTMYACFLLLLALVVNRLYQKRKERRSGEAIKR